MAATVYSGSGNWSYTNSTGENVRVIIGIALAADTANLDAVSGSYPIKWYNIVVIPESG